MIAEALRVLLFGMLGVFLVLGIIFGVIVALSRISAATRKRASSVLVSDPDSDLDSELGSAPHSEPEEIIGAANAPTTLILAEPIEYAPIELIIQDETPEQLAYFGDEIEETPFGNYGFEYSIAADDLFYEPYDEPLDEDRVAF